MFVKNSKRIINLILIFVVSLVVYYLYHPFGAIMLVGNCFEKYEVSSDTYLNSKHDFITFYHISGHAEHDSFRMSEDISGYVHEGRSSHTSFRVNHEENKTFQFSGEVIKYAPDWLTRLFFGGRNTSLPILVFNGKKYESLLSQANLSKKEWYENLPGRCKY